MGLGGGLPPFASSTTAGDAVSHALSTQIHHQSGSLLHQTRGAHGGSAPAVMQTRTGARTRQGQLPMRITSLCGIAVTVHKQLCWRRLVALTGNNAAEGWTTALMSSPL